MKRTVLLLTAILSLLLISFVAMGAERSDPVVAGEKLYNENKKADAILELSQVADMIRSGDENPRYCRAMFIAGNACLETNRFIEALDFFSLALNLAEKTKQTELIGNLSTNIGVVYAIFNDYDKASHYFQVAYDYLTKYPNDEILPILIANLVNAYSKAGKADEARKYFRLQAKHPLPDKAEQQYHIYYNQGVIAAADHNPAANLYYQQKAMEVVDSHKMPDLMRTDLYDEIGRSYLELGDTEKALTAYKSMLRLANAGGHVFQINEANRKIANIYRERQMPDSAAVYLGNLAALSDSTFNMQEFNATKGRLDKYEYGIKQQRIKLLEQTNHILVWSLIFGGVLLLIGAGWIISVTMLNRRLKEARLLLIHKNKELISAMDNKEAELKPEDTAATVVTDEKATEEESHEGDKYEMSEELQRSLLKRIDAILSDVSIITDSSFSLARMAQLAETNTKYISKVINSVYGMSFKSILNERRIMEASRRLSDSENYGHLTVTAIGEEVGFNSSTGFAEAFKRVNGMTPGAYRKLAASTSV